ncbi:hypothetical protein K1W69_01880 [Hoeflea sp. WL0058]|uniref:Uncharacterized protein n=1 Tax=Flavimaribacter sediminis TaxID=2865987 RepID=A0AAE3CZL4_9HYPH|nr:hypothetical protein [Flavimaribacter sediminis]MBW8635918.1 hypothetical protein [Flavimaribacter sediminis]
MINGDTIPLRESESLAQSLFGVADQTYEIQEELALTYSAFMPFQRWVDRTMTDAGLFDQQRKLKSDFQKARISNINNRRYQGSQRYEFTAPLGCFEQNCNGIPIDPIDSILFDERQKSLNGRSRILDEIQSQRNEIIERELGETRQDSDFQRLSEKFGALDARSRIGFFSEYSQCKFEEMGFTYSKARSTKKYPILDRKINNEWRLQWCNYSVDHTYNWATEEDEYLHPVFMPSLLISHVRNRGLIELYNRRISTPEMGMSFDFDHSSFVPYFCEGYFNFFNYDQLALNISVHAKLVEILLPYIDKSIQAHFDI